MTAQEGDARERIAGILDSEGAPSEEPRDLLALAKHLHRRYGRNQPQEWDALSGHLQNGWLVEAENIPAAGARAEAVEATLGRVRRIADQWHDTPDYQPSDYDRGRVDQRHDLTEQLLDALTAAGVAPQEPQALDREKVKAWLQREFGSVLAHDPHNPERFWGGSADALCVAYTEGKLTC